MSALLGCIADDFTGGTDLAGMLVKHGMRTVQMIGVPQGPPPQDADAIVVALKSRTTPPEEAVAESLAALKSLKDAGCRQFYFKYCSTFDSTDRGNIGPVTDALMTALDTNFTIACPAFPENKRTIFKGYLYAGDVLLSESGMQNHPLTPMTDPNLVRVLQRQTQRKVGLVSYETVAAGSEVIRAQFETLQGQGVEIAIVDATSNDDLLRIGAACADLPLVTAGSGIGLGLPQNFRSQGLLTESARADSLPPTDGLCAIVSGSCSVATQAQVAMMIKDGRPAFTIDPLRLAAGEDLVKAALAWAAPLLPKGPVLIYATAAPEDVKAVQSQLGVEHAGQLVERALAAIAQGLVRLGVHQLVVAGGETSGAVVKALGVKGLRIGAQIDPGVPWTVSIGDMPLALALKSGNFGTPDFFLKAWDRLL
jgi:uncharacterized protein YgbK (DUF1537 family)